MTGNYVSNDHNRKSKNIVDYLDFNAAPTGRKLPEKNAANLYQEIQQDNGDRYMVKKTGKEETKKFFRNIVRLVNMSTGKTSRISQSSCTNVDFITKAFSISHQWISTIVRNSR